MKKLFSTFSVALGLLALASCSQEDDFTQKKASLQNVGEGDLIVTVDDFENESGAKTRSFLSRDMQTRYYVVSDELKVYDNDLHKYDIFKFNWKDDSKGAGVFRRSNTTSNITEAKWALYPKADVLAGHWEYNETTDNSETTVVMDIPGLMEYDGTYDVNDKEFETPLYKDVLPRWGQVESTADGAALQTNLSYMTGILRLQLAGIPDYAKAVRIQMLEGGLATNPVIMSGSYSTIIAKNDVKQTDAALAADKNVTPSDIPAAGEAIYIDLRTMGAEGAPLKDIDASKAVVYVPLVTTTKAVDIVVSICNDPTVVDVTDDTDFGGSTATYTEYSRFKNKVIKKGKIYGNSKEYNLALDGEGPEAISDALELEEVQEGEDLILKAKGDITICDPDNTILIPNKKAASITIDLSEVKINKGCTDVLYLKYKDASGEGKFPGKVIFKAGDTGTKDIKLNVALDSTPFQISGKGNAGDIVSLENVDATAFTLDAPYDNAEYTLTKNVKTITVNSKITTDDIVINNTKNAGVTDVIVNGIAGDITNADNKVTNVTISGVDLAPAQAGAINVGGNVVMNGTSSNTGTIDALGTVTMSGKAIAGDNITANGDVTISEDANGAAGNVVSHFGNISVQHNTWTTAITYPLLQTDDWSAGGSVSISGNTLAKDVKSNADFSVSEQASAETVTLKGNATVNASKEMESVTKSITFKNNANLNLTQGYLAEVITSGKTIKLYHGENAAFTAIGKVDNADKLVAQNVSKWNGKKIGSTFAGNYALDVTNKAAWTATQVGQQLETAASFQLRSNIDLDNKDWKGVNTGTAAYDINGLGHTISNVNLVGNNKETSTMAGFVYNAADALTANDLTLNGVKTTIKAVSGAELKGVGGFVGVADAAVTLERVSIKLATGYFGSMDGTKNIKSYGIGGAIGIANDAATLKGVTVDASDAILSGYYGLGGFIGIAANTVDVLTDPELGDRPETACAVKGVKSFWVTQLNLGSFDNDPKQGMTGYYIGTVDLTKAVKIEDAADVKPTLTIGGKANEAKAFNVVTGSKMQVFSRADQTLIGQSGFNVTTTNPEINGKTYSVKKTGESFIDGSGILYNVTVTAYQ